MKSIVLAAVTVQFVGIVMLMEVKHQGVDAVMPPIPITTAWTVGTGGGASIVDVESSVERHAAIIVLDRPPLQAFGWQQKTLQLATGVALPYFTLSGETIDILSPPVIDTPTVPVELTRVQSTCGRQLQLSPAFLPPYRGAAGVVHLRHGTLSACKATVREADGTTKTLDRVDSKLVLPDSTPVLIVATKDTTNRALLLAPGTTVYFSNVPSRLIDNGSAPDMPDMTPHNQTYVDMLDHTEWACSTPPPAASNASPCAQPTDLVARRQMSPSERARVVAVTAFLTRASKIMNAECSNSAWP